MPEYGRKYQWLTFFNVNVKWMNEWMNFIKVIENSTRIILTIGIQFLVFGGVFMEAAR